VKLDVKAFGLAGGIIWSASIFILTWLEIWGYGSISAASMVKSYYIGYSVRIPYAYSGDTSLN